MSHPKLTVLVNRARHDLAAALSWGPADLDLAVALAAWESARRAPRAPEVRTTSGGARHGVPRHRTTTVRG